MTKLDELEPPTLPYGKQHCGNEDKCEKDPYDDNACDCGCSRCGEWNDYLEDLAEYRAERKKIGLDNDN